MAMWRKFWRRKAESDAGRWGEEQAREFLAGKGYRILGVRVRLDPRNEIDLVARDGESVVFVEVKTRAGEEYGRPFAAVDRKKRHAQSRAAVRYLARLRFPRIRFRFDAIEVVGTPGDGAREIRHIENAFPLDSRYHLP